MVESPQHPAANKRGLTLVLWVAIALTVIVWGGLISVYVLVPKNTRDNIIANSSILSHLTSRIGYEAIRTPPKPITTQFSTVNDDGSRNLVSLKEQEIINLYFLDGDLNQFLGGNFQFFPPENTKEKLIFRYQGTLEYQKLIQNNRSLYIKVVPMRFWSPRVTLKNRLRMYTKDEKSIENILDNSEKNTDIDLFEVKKVSFRPDRCDCHKYHGRVFNVSDQTQYDCDCMLNDVFFKKEQGVNYFISCVPPVFFWGPSNQVGCEVQIFTRNYEVIFYIKRDYLNNFDEVSRFVLEKLKLASVS